MINHYILNLLTESPKNTFKSNLLLISQILLCITAEWSCVCWYTQKENENHGWNSLRISHRTSFAFVMGDVSGLTYLSYLMHLSEFHSCYVTKPGICCYKFGMLKLIYFKVDDKWQTPSCSHGKRHKSLIVLPAVSENTYNGQYKTTESM